MNSTVSSLSPAHRRSPLFVWVAMGCVLLFAAGLRSYQIGRGSFWYDEVVSVEAAMGQGPAADVIPTDVVVDDPPRPTDRTQAEPWWNVRRGMTGPARGMHPPLYYILLRWWCDLFGYTEAGSRSFSAVVSVIGVALLFLVVREFGDDTTAVWSAAIMAVAQTQIVFAQEARNYALVQAFCLTAMYAVVRIEHRGPSGWTAVGLAARGVTAGYPLESSMASR